MTGNADRKSPVAKAGKRHGSIVIPAPLNSDKEAARIAGEKQFVCKTQQYVEKTVTVYSHSEKRFVQKAVAVPVDFTYDHHRKREVHSPGFKEKGAR